MTLLIGSSLHDPLSIELFDLILPHSLPAPQHPDVASYHPLPEIKHTFRPDHKPPPRFISAVSAALVVAPWVILLNLVSFFFFPLAVPPPIVYHSTNGNHSGLKLPRAQHIFFLPLFCHLFFASAPLKDCYFGIGSASNLTKSSFTLQFSPFPLSSPGKRPWRASVANVLAENDDWQVHIIDPYLNMYVCQIKRKTGKCVRK